MTIKTAPEKEAVKEVMLDLPIKRSSLLSHADNIDYALEQIQAYDGDNPVVGYFMRRLLGVSEKYHRILPQEVAESIVREDKSFAYVTLDRLLKRKKEIASGKYKMRNGLVVALNPSYAH